MGYLLVWALRQNGRAHGALTVLCSYSVPLAFCSSMTMWLTASIWLSVRLVEETRTSSLIPSSQSVETRKVVASLIRFW